MPARNHANREFAKESCAKYCWWQPAIKCEQTVEILVGE